MGDDKQKIRRTDEEWQKLLTPMQYEVLRRHGTERAFTGPYVNDHEPGRYLCAGCGQALFDAAAKYDSGSGWPSFWRPVEEAALETHDDSSLGMRRIEIRCSGCGGHLGHVFEDGPRPTGLRYCINGAALKKVSPP
jgi:peptide-methionine (R)-S-oxide reductase